MTDFNFFNERPLHKYRKSDPLLIILTILLTGMGLVTLYFASVDFASLRHNDPLFYVKKQIVPCLVGLGALGIFSIVKIEAVRRLLMVMSLFVILLCILTLITGSDNNTVAQRWLVIPGINVSLQPSEFVKFVLVLYLANQFDKQESLLNREESSVLPAVTGLIVFSALVIVNDFSTGFLILCCGIVMFFACGSKLLWLMPFSVIALPLSALLIFSKSYRVERIINFLSPGKNLSDGNLQPMRANAAIASAGFFGSGLGTGIEKASFIPEVSSDYIFAGWTEAMGFFGVVIYMILLAVFAWRIFYCAFTCYDRFASYACFGFGLLIVAQSLVNIAVVAGILPSTGIPLPFFSAGGSSIVVVLAMCGFVINASRIEKKEYETKVEDVVYE